MNKRAFLKTASTLAAGTLAARHIGLAEQSTQPAQPAQPAPRKNWAGNITYSAAELAEPTTSEQIQALLKGTAKLKPLGTRHAFNDIADTSGEQVSLKHLDSIHIDRAARTVTVGPGVTYGQLAPVLDRAGFALHNLASLPHISVAGACATATHGSGIANRNLSSAVSGLEMIPGAGETVTLSRAADGQQFLGAVVGLGGLGFLTRITLDLEPTYQVAQTVYEGLSFDRLPGHLDEIMGAGYSVSLFTDWQNHRATQVWIKSRVSGRHPAPAPAEFFGARRATQKLHPLAGHNPESCTDQLGIPGPWYERLPHFRMNFTPSSGAEMQTEYFVPRSRAVDAIFAVESLRDRITPSLFITELRTIAADELWLSPCYKRDALTIHFTWKPDWPTVQNILPLLEEKLAPFDARPHWAKLFAMPQPQIAGFTKRCRTSKPSCAAMTRTAASATAFSPQRFTPRRR